MIRRNDWEKCLYLKAGPLLLFFFSFASFSCFSLLASAFVLLLYIPYFSSFSGFLLVLVFCDFFRRSRHPSSLSFDLSLASVLPKWYGLAGDRVMVVFIGGGMVHHGFDV